MRLRTSIIYALLFIVCIVFGLTMFPQLGESAEIPLIPLIGLGSWLFGKRIALILIIPILTYSYFLSSVIYTEISIYYEAMGCGTITLIITSVLVGNIRENYNTLKVAKNNLDERVAARSLELDHLTVKLINEVEATRIHNGQTLHDGIGQQLTGIQLYCSSLAEETAEHSNPIASLADSIRIRAQRAHHVIRKTARLLFPVRMNEIGLIPALNELTSCLNEMEHLSVDITTHGDYAHISDTLALSLYRICHESAMCAATAMEADTIHLVIDAQADEYMLSVQHNGRAWSLLQDNMEQRLIRYRLDVIGGMFEIVQNDDDMENITYRIPITV
jgi:glucose-6-phosphate-specific signal transduction histidine kinase